MIDLYLFIPACFALNLAFGPNNLMALSNGAEAGFGFAVMASLGRLLAFAPMIVVSAFGLGVILSASAWVFTAIKLFGAVYLIWLGVRLLRQSFAMGGAQIDTQNIPLGTAFRREFLVALGNPKAILIFAAFFPQFVVIENYASSYAVLGAIFLLLELGAIAIYAGVGQFAARKAARKMHLFQRASGFGMVLFGALMLLAKRPTV